MKNLKKTLAVVTAIAAMLVSVSAFAEVETSFTGVSGIDNPVCEGIETGAPEVTVTVNAASSGDMTFIILNDGANEEDVQEEDILYIDQHAVSEGKSFTGIINPDRASEGAETLPDGYYLIKVGYQPASGNFTIARATLHVETTSSGKTVTIVWGDVNSDNDVTASDATQILLKTIGAPPTMNVKDVSGNAIDSVKVGEQLLKTIVWGDVNSDSDVTASDATQILLKTIGAPPTINVKDVSGNAIDSVKVGEAITITYSD